MPLCFFNKKKNFFAQNYKGSPSIEWLEDSSPSAYSWPFKGPWEEFLTVL